MADPSTAWLKPLYTWRSAITESNLSSTTKHLALTLSLHMSERGDSCFPGRKLLSAETGLDLRTVDRHMKILAAIEEGGEDTERAWLRINRGGGRGKANEYRAVVPKQWHRAAFFDATPTPATGTDKGRQGAGVRDINGGADAEREAEDTVKGGTVPPEYSSSSTESKERAREAEQPDPYLPDDRPVEIPDLPAVEWSKGKLRELWREMWEFVGTTPGGAVRYRLPKGLTVDVWLIPYEGSLELKSRRVVVWREGSFSDYAVGELTPAMKKWETERATFWNHVFSKNGEKVQDWIDGSASGYPPFHACWTEKLPGSLKVGS